MVWASYKYHIIYLISFTIQELKQGDESKVTKNLKKRESLASSNTKENIPNSYSWRGSGGTALCSSFKPSDSDLEPHGNLAKVDNEDVASYYK